MKKIMDYFKKDPEGDFENGTALNQANDKRNWIIFGVFTAFAGAIYFAGDYFMGTQKKTTVIEPAIDFGAVIDNDFTNKDNQSALTAQQISLEKQQRTIDKLLKTIESIESRNQAASLDLRRNFDKLEQVVTEKIASGIEAASIAQMSNANTVTPVDPFGAGSEQGEMFKTTEYTLPPRPNVGRYDADTTPYQGGNIAPSATSQNNIDSFSLSWEGAEENLPHKRTPDNYVPAGSFVTAVVTGGADANAGVNGQGDTAPMVFQTLNAGILPNGKPSKLSNCTIIGSVYGEISSSRGIVRTQRLSCIFDDEIIDIPVEGTVFNFGRNGIRGTTIMKNGKIVQMAGISGILTGIGETGKALSETTSTSALGTTSTIGGSDALLNLAGSSAASVGSKLADYYIKLAEQYHPIVELNPGNTVNIVFLKGFPLDPVGIKEYEEALANQEQTPASVTGQILNTISNPLFENMPNNIAPQPNQQGGGQSPINYNQQAQTSSAFGRVN